MNHAGTGRGRLTVVGCGDAFGSGGRLQTCFHVDAGTRFLIDCGATALTGLKRSGLDPGSIDAIVLTHMHGDHFAGIPFLVRETQIAATRTRPLTIIGPPGHETRVRQAMDLLFPGSVGASTFELVFVDYAPHQPTSVSGLTVLAVRAQHTAGTDPHAVRVTSADVTIAYSGDTEWIDDLPSIAEGADVFICECYRLEPVPNHIDYRTLMHHRHRLRCKRLVLTHMHGEVLALEGPGVPHRLIDGECIEL